MMEQTCQSKSLELPAAAVAVAAALVESHSKLNSSKKKPITQTCEMENTIPPFFYTF